MLYFAASAWLSLACHGYVGTLAHHRNELAEYWVLGGVMAIDQNKVDEYLLATLIAQNGGTKGRIIFEQQRNGLMNWNPATNGEAAREQAQQIANVAAQDAERKAAASAASAALGEWVHMDDRSFTLKYRLVMSAIFVGALLIVRLGLSALARFYVGVSPADFTNQIWFEAVILAWLFKCGIRAAFINKDARWARKDWIRMEDGNVVRYFIDGEGRYCCYAEDDDGRMIPSSCFESNSLSTEW